MPITSRQRAAAQEIQHRAAHHSGRVARLVAGPGTGKSSVIEERVYWLLNQGFGPDRIVVVSFTRASANELRSRVHRYCRDRGRTDGGEVRVTTLHALALRILRRANLLEAYPEDPIVMDTWELEQIFDSEFGLVAGIPRTRGEKVRREHEAFWDTGEWGPANYVPPAPPISPAERALFAQFHPPRTQLYSCVLPGELVRLCVDHIAAGNLDLMTFLGLQHLIVDEFQDLNPCDLQFVNAVIERGAITLVAGDDDQSIYSFRYASPAGIQQFTSRYPEAGSYTLVDCFRCTPAVLDATRTLISAYPLPGRIPKDIGSLYESAEPPLAGTVRLWRFNRGDHEARAIATSCGNLIGAGISPRDILILISDRNLLQTGLVAAFTEAGVPFEPPSSDGYLDSEAGRLAFALLRIVCDDADYVAHRVLLGLLPRVGLGTCAAIAQLTIENNLNFRRLFREALPSGVFNGHRLRALLAGRQLIERLSGWTSADSLDQRDGDLQAILEEVLDADARDAWRDKTGHLPRATTLGEVREYLFTSTDQQATEVLRSVYERLGQTPPEQILPPRVRMMTMHGAKGLSAQVVFIPGLEERIFPGDWRRPYAGLVLEAARLLYVSISRARAACIISYATSRIVHGEWRGHAPSRFTTSLGGAFGQPAAAGLTTAEVERIAEECRLL